MNKTDKVSARGANIPVGRNKTKHTQTTCHIQWEYMLRRKVKLGEGSTKMNGKEVGAILDRWSGKASPWR